MPDYRPGRLAKSLAGHDKDRLYVIIGTEGNFCLLSDGRLKPLSAPKKKKIKHIQIGPDTELSALFGKGETVRDEDIRRVIKNALRAENVSFSGGLNVES